MTPSQRNYRPLDRQSLIRIRPLKAFTKRHISPKGRNGHIIAWHRGGGHPKAWRRLNFYTGIVEGLENDPHRSPWLARLFNPDLHKHGYTQASNRIQRGSLITNDPSTGCNMPLTNIPIGSLIHNLNCSILRAAGTCGHLIQKTITHGRVKLASGEQRYFSLNSLASIGRLSGENRKITRLGKAGRKRWLGRRPKVRGVAINPVDHPHGGGEGRTSGGRPSVTPWGKPTKL